MLTSIAIILLSGLIMGWIFSKLRLPALLGMMIVGIIMIFAPVVEMIRNIKYKSSAYKDFKVHYNGSIEKASSVKSFNDEFVNLSVCETKELFKQVAEFNLSEIYVPAKSLTSFSQNIFGSWSILTEGLFLLEKDKVKKALSENQEEKINKEIAKKDYSLDELQVAYERYCNEHNFSVEKNCKDYFDVVDYRSENEKSDKKKVSILSAITESYSKIDFELR